MADYLPHTPEEVRDMLDFLGLRSLEELFAHIPASVRLSAGLDMAPGMSEPDFAAMFAELTAMNVGTTANLTCFAGAGAYDHEVPPVVRALGSRSEFVTAYTPYQPEVAQGVLQAIFEYQTLVSRLAGLPIANASIYDGATSLVEALNMAGGATGRSKMLISAGVHPHWRAVARTFAFGTGHELVEVPLRDGVTDWSGVDATDVACVVSAYPNVLGVLEDLSVPEALAHANGALFVIAGDPVAAGALRTAGEWGADVFVGEGQPFGTALSFGGPFLGLFACTEAQIRRLPGRIVGETVDSGCRRSFVTTLRAREQDIRREKATSNICSNQTLMAVTAAIQLGYLGTEGLADVATRCAQGAHYLYEQLLRVPGVLAVSDAPFFREFAVRVPGEAKDVLAAMVGKGFLGGIALESLDPDHAGLVADQPQDVLIVAVTEKRTKNEIDAYVTALQEVLA